MKTNKSNAAPTLRHDSRTVFQRSKVQYGLPLPPRLIPVLYIFCLIVFIGIRFIGALLDGDKGYCST